MLRLVIQFLLVAEIGAIDHGPRTPWIFSGPADLNEFYIGKFMGHKFPWTFH